MAKQARKINYVTYRYKKTGVNKKTGKSVYTRVGKSVRPSQHTSFQVLGQRTYKANKGKKNTYVAFAKPRVKSVTRTYSNGTKTVTYFKRGK